MTDLPIKRFTDTYSPENVAARALAATTEVQAISETVRAQVAAIHNTREAAITNLLSGNITFQGRPAITAQGGTSISEVFAKMAGLTAEFIPTVPRAASRNRTV